MGEGMMTPKPRPETWPSPREAWLESSRYCNALAEEHGLEGCVRTLGIDLPTLMHVAEQRALITMLVTSGRADELATANEPAAILTDAMDKAALVLFQACYMDGLAIGYQARVIEERETT